MKKFIKKMRKDYTKGELIENMAPQNPVGFFKKWFLEAVKSEGSYANAMTLATADKNGTPSARVVLLKEANNDGFVFCGNYQSKKGQNLKENPKACLNFFWPKLERQVRVEGVVKKCSSKESDAIFNERPLEARIAAIISPQSEIIEGRWILEKNFFTALKFYSKTKPKRPLNWGGYCLIPHAIEFWQGRAHRLHDRLLYTKSKNKWKVSRLAP